MRSRVLPGLALVALFSVWPGGLSSSAAEATLLPQLPPLGAFAGSRPTIDWNQVPSLERLDLGSFSALVVRVSDGRLMGTLNPDYVLPLASLTKLMTAVVTLEVSPNLKEPVAITKADNSDLISPYAAAGDSISHLAVPDGVQFSRRDVISAALVASANNAAAALARSSGLSPSDFVARMNERALVLGLTSTTFTEATGLDPHNTSTAFDYAVLARYAWANKTIRTASVQPAVTLTTLAGKTYRLATTNPLVRKPPAGVTIVASKTGYLDEAGYNVAFEWKARGGVTYLGVLLNAPTAAARTADMRRLISWLEPKR